MKIKTGGFRLYSPALKSCSGRATVDELFNSGSQCGLYSAVRGIQWDYICEAPPAQFSVQRKMATIMRGSGKHHVRNSWRKEARESVEAFFPLDCYGKGSVS